MTESFNRTLELHPEKRINSRMAKHRKSGKKTWIEQRMAALLDRIGVDYVFQYPVLRYDVDFAIPGLMIAIECDGAYWHRDEKKDLERQKRIAAEGWTVLRFTGSKINKCLDQVQDELLRVVGNHAGEYNFTGVEVLSVEKWKVKTPRTLYNLTVEEDESYVVHGFVVHNCRCMAIPANVGEIASKRLTPKAKAKLVGDVYKQKDGTFKKRGLFKKKTGKNPPGRYVAPKARKAGTKRRRIK
jgi:very-short-patch-repair endonuclease